MQIHQTVILRRGESGAALMAVFWIIAMLTLMIFTTIVLVRGDVELVTTQKKAFRATLVAEKGINIGANPQVQKIDQHLLHGVTAEGDRWDVKIKGEGGQFNINRLIQNAKNDSAGEGRNFLETLLTAMGMADNDRRGWVIDNLINWTDQDDEPDGDADTYEKLQYEEEGFLNYPFNRPFYNLDEVLLVRGMNELPGLCPNWRDYFTIYSGGMLDVNEASAELLAVASLSNPAEAQRFADDRILAQTEGKIVPVIEDAREVVELRWGKDNIEDTEDDEKLDVQTVAASLNMDDELASARLTNTDQTTRIESTATVGDFRKRIVVIVRQRSTNPQILMREEVPLFD
jgi:general secretion pathway protein K